MVLAQLRRFISVPAPVKDFVGTKVLVTGAASGIGRATAEYIGRLGAELILTDINGEQLGAVVDSLQQSGVKVLHSTAFDISDYDAVTAFGQDVMSSYGPPDVVMNIAGVSAWGTVQTLEHRHWRQMVDVNLMGPIHIIETFVPAMIEAGKPGHLVNVSSAAGVLGLPWHAAYSASKFGLVGVSEVLRFDLERHRIGVTVVCPGAVETGLVETLQIPGIDRSNPAVAKQIDRFPKVSAHSVAVKIADGVTKNRFLVFTSHDVRLGYFMKRKFALPYEISMRVANNQYEKIARISAGGR